MNELYCEREQSLRKFLVSELMKQTKGVEVERDLAERTQLVIDPSANVGDVQLARRFSNKYAN
jgi:hypothetical protein